MENQYLEISHWPEQGTPVKNQVDDERLVVLSEGVCDPLDNWLADE